MKVISLVLASLALVPAMPGLAQSNPEETQKPIRCEESVVTGTGNYFKGDPSSGNYAVFKTNLGVSQFKNETAAVVDRTAKPGSILATQKVGDRVRVCLISYPAKDQFCNPDQDRRGRYYRVYNYRQKATYSGTNANHLCGGA